MSEPKETISDDKKYRIQGTKRRTAYIFFTIN